MPRYENFIKVGLGAMGVAVVLAGVGMAANLPLLMVVGGVVVAVGWVLLLAGLMAGALRPLIDVARRDVPAQLAHLAALHDAGKISDEEFVRAKRRCLEG